MGEAAARIVRRKKKKTCAITFTSAYTQDNGPGQAPNTQQSNRTTGETREKSHDMYVRKTLCKKFYKKSKYFSLLSKLDRYAQYCAPERTSASLMRFACFALLDHRHAESHHCSNHCKEREIFLFFPHISSSLGFARSAIASQNNSNRRRLILPVQKHERRHRRRRKTSVSCAPCFVSMMPQDKNFDASFDVDVAREQHRTRCRPSRFSMASSMAAFDAGCHEPPPGPSRVCGRA